MVYDISKVSLVKGLPKLYHHKFKYYVFPTRVETVTFQTKNHENQLIPVQQEIPFSYTSIVNFYNEVISSELFNKKQFIDYAYDLMQYQYILLR